MRIHGDVCQAGLWRAGSSPGLGHVPSGIDTLETGCVKDQEEPRVMPRFWLEQLGVLWCPREDHNLRGKTVLSFGRV